jgi:hypothetical protein
MGKDSKPDINYGRGAHDTFEEYDFAGSFAGLEYISMACWRNVLRDSLCFL